MVLILFYYAYMNTLGLETACSVAELRAPFRETGLNSWIVCQTTTTKQASHYNIIPLLIQ
jgi:hypothetical protein